MLFPIAFPFGNGVGGPGTHDAYRPAAQAGFAKIVAEFACMYSPLE
jgi:hypothetical protein